MKVNYFEDKEDKNYQIENNMFIRSMRVRKT